MSLAMVTSSSCKTVLERLCLWKKEREMKLRDFLGEEEEKSEVCGVNLAQIILTLIHLQEEMEGGLRTTGLSV